ncbi:MAG: YceI family protein, partial [Cruoricaptor ignavus]|nr:YceI family protein [Cruoricaptor ignavus]
VALSVLFIIKMNQKLSILFLFISAIFLSQSNAVTILGKTNINTFRCTNSKFYSPQDFQENKNQSIQLNVSDFDCNNRMMTSDFRKTLKSDTFPKMDIKFLKLEKKYNNNYVGIMEVKIMDKTKIYEVAILRENNHMRGSGKVRFSDFGIVPPKKLGGTIVVRDELDLSFVLKTFFN